MSKKPEKNEYHERLFDLMLSVMSNSKTIHTCIQDLLGYAIRTSEPEVVEIVTTMARANNEIHRRCKSITSAMTAEDVKREICKILGEMD